jgi:uncharacterized protein
MGTKLHQENGQRVESSHMAPSPKVQAAEIAVFLLLMVPSMVLSLLVTRQSQLSFVLAATAVIFRDLGLVGLILFFLWRNGEPLSRLGWTWDHPVRELIIGMICFFPVFLGAALFARILMHIGLSGPATPPSFLKQQGPAETLLALFLVTVVALAEETIFRGYLLLRFLPLLRNTTVSVLLSSAIFAVGHGYEGPAGLVTIGFMGAAFALVYLWRGSLVAPIVMHSLQDFVGIVLLPALELK